MPRLCSHTPLYINSTIHAALLSVVGAYKVGGWTGVQIRGVAFPTIALAPLVRGAPLLHVRSFVASARRCQRSEASEALTERAVSRTPPIEKRPVARSRQTLRGAFSAPAPQLGAGADPEAPSDGGAVVVSKGSAADTAAVVPAAGGSKGWLSRVLTALDRTFTCRNVLLVSLGCTCGGRWTVGGGGGGRWAVGRRVHVKGVRCA